MKKAQTKAKLIIMSLFIVFTLSLLIHSVQSAPAIVFEDTFVEDVDTILQNHPATPSGGTWTEVEDGADFVVLAATDNLMFTNDNNDAVIYTADDAPTTAEYNVSVTIVTADSADDIAIIVGRFTDITETYSVHMSGTQAENFLRKIDGGVPADLDSNPAGGGVTAGDEIIFEILDTAKNVYKNGALWMSSADNTVGATGKGGLGCGNFLGTDGGEDCTITWKLDTFNITEAEAAPPANSCTYGGSGDWVIACTDWCNVTTPTLVDGRLILAGAGKVNVTTNLSTTAFINISGGCSLDVYPTLDGRLSVGV